ncbi:Colicin I receptor precursor [Elizabethkingia miricola]|nr:Colicin I receptor precursor [Elizabethkingia miricola]
MHQKEYTQILLIKPMLKVSIACCFLWAPTLLAQQTTQKITIDKKNTSPVSVLQEIEKNTSFRFIYAKHINLDKPLISLSFKAANINTVLQELQKQTGLSFLISGNTISVKQENNNNNGKISGTVVELENLQPLAGATLVVRETGMQSKANNQGKYELALPAGSYTLDVSFMGYDQQTIKIESLSGRENKYDITLQGNSNANKENVIKEVFISSTGKKRTPVAYSSVKQVLQEVKNSPVTISAISSEQINKSADRNAGEVVKKIAGISVRDDKFIIIRGMNERYNLTYLNDNVAPSTEVYSRAFALDLIPTRIIDRILVYKTPSPDLLGDMTGGAVKILTKNAKAVKSFDIELQQGYREGTTYQNLLTYKGGGTDFLGFDDGTRKLPDIVPGYGDFNKARISQKEYVKGFNPTLTYGKKTALPMLQITANYYNSFKLWNRKLSMLSSLSYKNEPLHVAFNRAQNIITYPQIFDSNTNKPIISPTSIGSYSEENQDTESVQVSLLQNFTYVLNDRNKFEFKNYLLQQGQNATILNTGFNNAGIFEHDVVDRDRIEPSVYKRNITLSYMQRFLYNTNISGAHDLKNDKHHFNWNIGFTYNNLTIPDQRQIRLQNLFYNYTKSPIGLVGDFDQNWVTQFRFINSDGVSEGGIVELGNISRAWTKNTEKLYNFSGDYTFTPSKVIKFKVGTFQQFKRRNVFRRTYTVNEGDLNDQGGVVTYNIGGDGRYMDFNKVYFRQQDLGGVWSDNYLRDDGSALKVYDRTSGADSYIATEQNNSFYAIVSFTPFSKKINLYGGIRVENNIQKIGVGVGAENASGSGGSLVTPLLINLKSLEWLPSVNFSYRPSDSWVFRASAGRTLNRPEFKEITPFKEVDYLAGQYVTGNANLVGSTAMNYDTRFEFYPKANEKGETFSIGAFYKDIKQPIERSVTSDLYFNMLSNITFMNADRAKVYGLEVDIRKDLSFLGGDFFRKLSVAANASYIKSEATMVMSVPNIFGDEHPTVTRKLQGQSPYLINAGLYYEKPSSGTKIGLIFNQTGERIYAVAIGKPAHYEANNTKNPGQRGSLIELPRKQLDFSFTQRLMTGLQMKLGVQNILNSAVEMAEDSNFDYQYNKRTEDTSVVMNGKTMLHINGDYISASYKPGRVYTLSIVYNF